MELLFLFYMFSTSLPQPGILSALRAKACLHHLRYGPVVCSRLRELPEPRNAVYRLAGIFSLTSEALLIFLSALIAILAGPWCDTYGHKGPLVITVVGAFMTTLCSLLVAFMSSDSSMWFNVLSVLPQGFSGGAVLMRACCYHSITKAVDLQLLRTMRFFALDMFGMLGKFGGIVLGWLLSHSIGSVVTLATAGLCQAALLIFVGHKTYVTDSTAFDRGILRRLPHLFSKANVIAACDIFSGSRENVAATLKRLFWLLALITIMNTGPEDILQRYTKIRFGWSFSTYIWISGFSNMVTAVGGILVVICFKLVCCSAIQLIWIGVTSAALRNIIIGVSTFPALFFINYLPAIPQGVGPAGVKASFAKLAPADETGKFLVLVTSCESMMEAVTRVVGSSMYETSAAIYPGLMFIVFAFFAFPAFAIIRLVTPEAESEEDETHDGSSSSSRGSSVSVQRDIDADEGVVGQPPAEQGHTVQKLEERNSASNVVKSALALLAPLGQTSTSFSPDKPASANKSSVLGITPSLPSAEHSEEHPAGGAVPV
ncbi:probable peptidoglycan muropeptide transporter SLC46 isoform X2 [Ornithodoros turicata]